MTSTEEILQKKYINYLQNEHIILIISDLLDLLEEVAPEVYSKSDEVMRADDLIKEIEKRD